MDDNYRIPIIDKSSYAGSYHAIGVDSTHALHYDPLVLLADYAIAAESYHARVDGKNPPYNSPVSGSRRDVWIRKRVAEMLVQVNALLAPYCREVFVLDGYRPIDCQRGLWSFYLSQARTVHPFADEETQKRYARQFIVDPSAFSPTDSSSWPAHTNGGAVDITMKHLDTGRVVNMGSEFEQITETSQNHFYERLLDQGDISDGDERLVNRRILHWAMHSVGFINDPFVFWHYDWGNQLYVKMAKKLFDDPIEKAWYGYVSDP